ncbi:MAG: hypothetical protein LBF60_02260 [Treponema sp.]|nr:hypothetical protein [Treponema sp.]
MRRMEALGRYADAFDDKRAAGAIAGGIMRGQREKLRAQEKVLCVGAVRGHDEHSGGAGGVEAKAVVKP